MIDVNTVVSGVAGLCVGCRFGVTEQQKSMAVLVVSFQPAVVDGTEESLTTIPLCYSCADKLVRLLRDRN